MTQNMDAMYWLYSIDALVRIVFAFVLLFIVVPVLAKEKPRHETFLTRFFWNFGAGIMLITVAGQILTLGSLFSPLTVALGCALVVLAGRARNRGISAWSLVKRSAENSFLAFLNIFDRRVNVPRRMRRAWRRTMARLREQTAPRMVRLQIAGWTALVAVAAALRLYRPLASANLGFADTYGHLYIVKLLREGRQVDPQYGPYPTGMHFLLTAIHHITNIDEILLMNFFGPVIGVLITLAVADTARRLSGHLTAGLLAGFLFATFIGGPSQYFVIGGAFETNDPGLIKTWAAIPYAELPTSTAGEFDLALRAFHRQTSALSQELAIALLFAAMMFLFEYLKRRERWHLLGFSVCTGAIAAVHPGVLIPLVIMSALVLIATVVAGQLKRGTVRNAVAMATLAIVIGSAWMIAFVTSPQVGGKSHLGGQSSAGSTIFYYFPFLRPIATADSAGAAVAAPRVWVAATPFLIVSLVLAVMLLVSAFVRRDATTSNRVLIALMTIVFLVIHLSAILGLPQIIETSRNSQWLVMTLAVLFALVAVEIALLVHLYPRVSLATANAAVAVAVLALWLPSVPSPASPAVHNRIVNYSGYGGTAYAVLRIARSYEPYTWTLVSYGQEFPMILGRGRHVPASDFLDSYDPGGDILPIPTRYVFLVVEKNPHSFQINTWSNRFNRAEIEERLQTWIHVYQASHSNLRVFHEDQDVRVYQIEHSPQDLERLSQQASR